VESTGDPWFSAIIQYTQDAIVGKDPHGVVTFWNPAAEKILGYRADEAIGRNFHTLVPPLALEDDELLRSELAGGKRVAEREQVRIGKGGVQVVIAITLAALRATDGRHIGSVAMIRDISERRRIEAHLRHSERLATLGTLSAAVVHELSQPLNYLAFTVDRMCKAPMPTGDGATLQHAREALERLMALVGDLRSLSRVEQKRLDRVELAYILEGALRLSAVGGQAGVRVLADIAAEACVRGDPVLLSQVFINLLSNAAHAVQGRPEGERFIRVTLRPSALHHEVEVNDNGCGIPAELLPRIFDLFFTTKPAQQGTGLGLAISRKIVEEGGGTIEVRSEVGEGTRFIVRLPAARS
jgi:PAS domain S-box-containing protein